jgi:pSer/pThr/pTyr-binding forkhead associated (FHA) protein
MPDIQQVLLTVMNVADTCTIGRGLVLAWTTSAPAELGRNPECGLHLPDGTVSRRHVRFSSEGERIVVESLTQSNGTFLDGEALEVG